MLDLTPGQELILYLGGAALAVALAIALLALITWLDGERRRAQVRRQAATRAERFKKENPKPDVPPPRKRTTQAAKATGPAPDKDLVEMLERTSRRAARLASMKDQAKAQRRLRDLAGRAK